MQHLGQMLANGLAVGCIYALVALGFVLVYRAVAVINFAQGEFVMISAFFGVMAVTLLRLPLALSYFVVLLAMAAFGFIVQRLTYYPLRGKPHLTVIICTVGLHIVLRNGARLLWGPYPLSFPSFFRREPIEAIGILIIPQNLFIIGVTGILFFLFYLFLKKTMMGYMMQAVAQDPEAARLMGVKVDRIVAITFVLNSLLAGTAGLLVAPIFLVTTDMGGSVLIKAFCSTIIGGFGSVPGAVVGGIFLGIVEILAAGYVSTYFKDGLAFGVIILVLLLAPQGIFRERVAERA